MKTETNQEIENWLTALLARLNRSKIIQLLKLKAIKAGRFSNEESGSCVACDNYQHKEQKR